jgi:phage terminase large subunit GpA-like protein
MLRADLKKDISFMGLENQKKHTKPPMDKISDYVDGKRVLPPGTPFPGIWRNHRTPYMVEPMNDLSPASYVQHITMMKGAQIGATACVLENTVGYYIGEMPAEILVVSATDKLLKTWAKVRLAPLIDSLGLQEKIFSQNSGTKSKMKATGDTLYQKQYPGGTLDLSSAQAAPSLRMNSKRIVLIDEVDGAPAELTTGEGNFVAVAEGRTSGFDGRQKVAILSTPTTVDDSLVYQYFLDGDQREYFMPCPHCGDKSDDNRLSLKWEGFHAETERGALKSVWYKCPHCGEAIFNHHKTKMLAAGIWEPTARCNSKFRRSYYIPSFLSPVGMLRWETIYEKYLQAGDNPDKKRAWTNLYLGLPFKDQGARPKVETVIELRGGYKMKEVPEGVLFLTMFIDVQRGSKNPKDPETGLPQHPERLELEVCGHGAGYRTWSIDYLRVEGDTKDPNSGAWAELTQMAQDGEFAYYRNDGLEFHPRVTLIDSGDQGESVDTVYRFCETWQSTYPSKGFGALKNSDAKKKKGDEANRSNYIKYKAAAVKGADLLYEISTNLYKNLIYNNLRISRQQGSEQRPGFCSFPREYGGENERWEVKNYFKMLTAEEKRRDGSFHAGDRRNEAIDCRAGNLCAGDIFLDTLLEAERMAARDKGFDRHQVLRITRRHIIEKLSHSVGLAVKPVV